MRLLIAVVLLSAAAAAPAGAADKVLIGRGSDPGVAVDARGTAHVAYNAPMTDPQVGEPLMYCAWPRGARTCAPRALLADGAAPARQPALVRAGPAAGQVTIVSGRKGLVALSSADGGASFGPPSVFGEGPFFEGAFGPSGADLALAERSNFRFRRLAGPAETTGGASLNPGYPSSSRIAYTKDGRPVFVSGGARPGIAVSSWSGQGDVQDPATWRGPVRIASSNDFALAGGPRGVWLLYADFGRGLENRMIARSFDGRRAFGRAHRIPAGRLGLPFTVGAALAQDPKGRLVAVWFNSPHDRLEYSASRTGAHWARPRILAKRVELPGRYPGRPRLRRTRPGGL